MTSHRSTFPDKSFKIAGKSTHFYQIVLENSNRRGKLEIPSKFVKDRGDDLSSPIVLKVSTGHSWEVEIVKNGDEIWLENGWQEFSDYHNLKHGHLLVFEFKGESHFHVSIFDMSAVEINYRKNESEEDDVSLQILDDSTTDDDDDLEFEDSDCGKLKGFADDPEADKNFISNYPFFKIVFNRQSNVRIPFRFVKRNMNWQTHTDTVMLQVGDKSWPVKLCVYSNHGVARLSLGWPVFARQNSLQPRDVCYFELIKPKVLRVSITRK